MPAIIILFSYNKPLATLQGTITYTRKDKKNHPPLHLHNKIIAFEWHFVHNLSILKSNINNYYNIKRVFEAVTCLFQAFCALNTLELSLVYVSY